jgi:hypothetical protein
MTYMGGEESEKGEGVGGRGALRENRRSPDDLNDVIATVNDNMLPESGACGVRRDGRVIQKPS